MPSARCTEPPGVVEVAPYSHCRTRLPAHLRTRALWYLRLLALFLLPPAVFGVAAFAVYWSGLNSPTVFDCIWEIDYNPRIKAPLGYSLTDRDRPLVTLSFAVNRATGDGSLWHFHVFNVAVHVLAGLVLFGVIRRTLLLPGVFSEQWRNRATAMGLVATTLWLVHPLQTSSVQYLVQRSEAMAGLAYLLTLYGFIRGATARRAPARNIWFAGAVLAASLGLACKAIVVTAPLLVVIYDRAFLSRSLGSAFRRHWHVYIGLISTWAVLLALGSHGFLLGRSAAVGFGVKTVTWAEYAITQPSVVLRYLRLSFWPDSLCLDYALRPLYRWQQVAPAAAAMAALLCVTGVALVRNSAAGVIGAWFFLILAPTSSVIPVLDLMFEHRMYLPLAAVAVVVSAGVWTALDRLQQRLRLSPTIPALAGVLLGLGAVGALGAATVFRVHDYRSEIAIWEDTIRKSPANPRARHNLGVAYQKAKRRDDAIREYSEAVKLLPAFPQAHNNLGVLLRDSGREEEAAKHFELALHYGGRESQPLNNLGIHYQKKKEPEMALRAYLESLRRDPRSVPVQAMAAQLWAEIGRKDMAVKHYREALRLYPGFTIAQINLAGMLVSLGQVDEAIEIYQKLLQKHPRSAQLNNLIGVALAARGEYDAAVSHYRRSIEAAPGAADAYSNLAIALFRAERFEESLEYFRKAIALNGASIPLRQNLGDALSGVGRHDEALAEYLKALQLAPGNAMGHYKVAGCYHAMGDKTKEDEHLREVARLRAASGEKHYESAQSAMQAGQIDQTIIHLTLGLRAAPESHRMLLELAWILAVHADPQYREPRKAVELSERACALTRNEDPRALNVLAAALASDGQFPRAVEAAEKALSLAEQSPDGELKKWIRELLAQYKTGHPYRENG